jgi:hypothetical protein
MPISCWYWWFHKVSAKISASNCREIARMDRRMDNAKAISPSQFHRLGIITGPYTQDILRSRQHLKSSTYYQLSIYPKWDQSVHQLIIHQVWLKFLILYLTIGCIFPVSKTLTNRCQVRSKQYLIPNSSNWQKTVYQILVTITLTLGSPKPITCNVFT